MKFTIGDHLQEIVSQVKHFPFIGNDQVTHGIVINVNKHTISGLGPISGNKVVIWYEIKNDELELINHWVPENKLELHKQTLRENKLKELGI